MASLRILPDGAEHPVNYMLLKELAEHLPREKAYQGIAEDLLKLGIPSITVELVDFPFGETQLDALWKTGGIEIHSALVLTRSFQGRLTDKQAGDLMREMDEAPLSVLEHMAENIEDIQDVEVQQAVGRKLAAHPDPAVRLELAQNWRVPVPILNIVKDDSDADVAAAAAQTLEKNA